METVIPRFFKLPEHSFFLFGPRGTGKSTWLHKEIDNALWIDLLQPEQFRSFKAKPERLKEIVLANLENRMVAAPFRVRFTTQAEACGYRLPQ